MQRHILGLFDGSVKRIVFTGRGSLDTGEVLEELNAAGLIGDDVPRKQAMHVVRRACGSLVGRGLLAGRYGPDMNNPGRETISWGLPGKL